MQKLTTQQAVIISGYTGILLGSFSELHKDVEKRLGRPVWTHEFPSLSEEIKAAYKIDFMSIQPVSEI